MTNAPFILVDGSSYLYRAFHALPPLTNSHGEPTGAVYGVVNMLKKLIAEYQPTHAAVIFDAPGKTFRDDLYAEYKANRPPMPDDMRGQIEPLHAVIRALGLPLLQITGVEADDVIGTLAQQAAANGQPVLISTGDKDMAQLVNDHVTLINTMSGKLMDHAGVIEKFGVPPACIIDWLALVGDSSDNIPGIPKCGPKTASKWLNEYGNINGVKDNAEHIGGKIGETLRANLDQLDLSYQLATIKCDVELDETVAELTLKSPDNDELKTRYQRLEFKTWLREVLDENTGSHTAAPAAEKTAVEYETILDQAHFDQWLKDLQAADAFAFDTETNSLNSLAAEIIGVSFAIAPNRAAYLPLAHDYLDAPQQLDRTAALAQLKPLLEDANRAKIGQHLKYDQHVLANHGITLRGFAHDTMLASYVLDSTASQHNMDALALHYLGRNTTKFSDIAGKGAKQKTFNQIGLDEAAPYAAEDADITLQLHQHLQSKLAETPALQTLYTELEMPLAPILQRIERNGVKIDADLLHQHSSELAQRLTELEMQAHDVAGGTFNLGSPKQLQEILFEKLQLPIIRKTPKGQPSTAEDVLQELAAAEHELPQLILEHRSLSKLKSTYTDKLPQQINPQTGRVHTSYHQAVAATGRLSSSDPNLQNIPIRTAEGRRIRQAFIAEPGHVLLAADYSQIELRIMAHLSGDAGLLKAFAEGADIHRATAAEIFGGTPESVEPEHRRAAKAINFGLIYGMSAFGLSKQLGIDRAAANEYIERYFSRYPGVKTYMDETRHKAHDAGFVETLLGRRLYLPDINARNAQRRQYAERTAINAPMQGTAADIIKRAMLAVAAWLETSDLNAKIIMQVHDELVFEIAESDLDAACEHIVTLMENAAELNVPLKVDVGVGQNWDEAH